MFGTKMVALNSAKELLFSAEIGIPWNVIAMYGVKICRSWYWFNLVPFKSSVSLLGNEKLLELMLAFFFICT